MCTEWSFNLLGITVEWLTFLAHIQEPLCLNLIMDIIYPERGP